MKYKILSLLALALTFNAYAGLESMAEVQTEKELLFKLAPKDALKCGTEIIGDHLAEATVHKVSHTTNEGLYIYFEISDSMNFNYRCSEKTVQKLFNYFESVGATQKLKSTSRIFQAHANSVICKTEKVDYVLETPQTYKYLVVKKVYGQRELTTYFGNEVNFQIFDDKNNMIGSCDDLKVTITKDGQDLSFSNEEIFNNKLKKLKEDMTAFIKKDEYSSKFSATVGGCRVDLAFKDWDKKPYSVKISASFLLQETESLFSGTTANEAWDESLNKDNCMLKI